MDPPASQAFAPPPAVPSTSSPAAASFPKLEVLAPSVPHAFRVPSKQINDGPDVARFLTSRAYRDIGAFVLQLNRALCPRRTPGSARSRTFPLGAKRHDPPSVQRLRQMLREAASYIDKAPPDPGPRRFGNVSFRTWHQLLRERADRLLEAFVAKDVLAFGGGERGDAQGASDGGGKPAGAVDELRAYLLGGFGSSQRLDYGTGHELSFLAFLGCLWKLGAFADGPEEDGEIERSIVLGVLEPYFEVVRRLILTYTLEPAGSHGVWGLDDHCFMPYIFGSAQLTRPISEGEPMPLEGSVERAPRPGDVVKPAAVEVQREANMYFAAVGFINDVKKGPFWEHSPILFDISGIKDGWGKINKGMIKMFNAEVLSKFPVVQHFPFGSLFSWEEDPEADRPQHTVHMANQPPAAAAGTAAPWAQATRMPAPPGPGIPYSRAAPRAPSGAPLAAPPATARPPAQMPSLPGPGAAPGPRGTAGAQIALTRAPWAKD